jgi:altronate dehydratase small subunit
VCIAHPTAYLISERVLFSVMTMTSKRALILHRRDNVATVTEDVAAGDRIAAALEKDVRLVEATERIPFGFKVALTDMARGETVYKYGEPIGTASQSISKGQLVHVHNVEGSRGRGDLARGGSSP